ncbi:MAG: hypothetical protein PHE02_03350 [Lachnospiraceae bacterium]|nr:hypothetical protein [Lachnospiraceae bacterium]
MKITIQTPLKNEEIKHILDGYEKDGITFTFAGKKGIGLEFDVQGDSTAKAAALAKQKIKETEWGKVLYFSVQEN